MDFATTAFTDDELSELALATPYSAVIDPNAVPWSARGDNFRSGLPEWYMAPAIGFVNTRRRRVVVASIIASFLVINGLGFCVTSGFLSLA
jgi:hypothetical protein